MTGFRLVMLAGVVAALPSMASAEPRSFMMAQGAAGIVPQPAEGWKAPPPAEKQPGPATGSAADSPAVSGQADGQPVVTPPQGGSGAGPSQAKAEPREPDKPNGAMSPPSTASVQGSAAPNQATMPDAPTMKTPEPSAKQ